MSDILRSPADLASAVRTLRQSRHLSAVELARRSGRSRDLIWRLESGRDVSSTALFDVLHALGANLQVIPARLPTLDEVRERFSDPQ